MTNIFISCWCRFINFILYQRMVFYLVKKRRVLNLVGVPANVHSLGLLDSMLFRVVGICSFAFFVLFSLYTSYILWGLALFC